MILLYFFLSLFTRLDVAARHLSQAVEYLKLCQPATSNYLMLGMATLGTFYKIIQKPELAVPRFKYVVDHSGL